MKKKKKYLMLSLVISILLAVALPLAIGLKAPYLMAITFLSFWFGYGLVMLAEEKFLKKYLIHCYIIQNKQIKNTKVLLLMIENL